MKAPLLYFLLFTCSILLAQEDATKVTSTIESVTVFTQGAQVYRQAKTSLPRGKSILEFTELTGQLNPESVQIKGEGNFTILSVRHTINYLAERQADSQVEKLITQKDSLATIIKEQNAIFKVLEAEEKLLMTNNNLRSEATGIEVQNLKAVAELYRNRLTELKLKQLKNRERVRQLSGEMQKSAAEINQIRGDKSKDNTSEIIVEVEANRALEAKFTLSYFTNDALWFPEYDMRVTDIDNPINLVYKAKVAQTSGENWEKVQLTLSTADPSIGGDAPSLQPWKLGYYQRSYSRNNVPVNSLQGRTITGLVTDDTGEPLIGATVLIKGTTVGTVTDFDGKYSLDIPAGSRGELTISYTGYSSQEVLLSNKNNYVTKVAPSDIALESVVVTGYAVDGVGIRRSGSRSSVKKENKSAKAPQIAQTENTTSIEFTIETPYTIKDDGQARTVQISTYDLAADYQYLTIPKLETAAFLTAKISDWERYNLLTGEANLYFEGTYLGRSVIDVENTTDTLELSLGRDKNIVVEREKVEEYTDRQFLGKNKTERVGWQIKVRNKKNQPIEIIIFDQTPISIRDDIEVENIVFGKASWEKKTGRLRWSLQVATGVTEQVEFRYEVKYPKNRRVRLE